MSNQQPTTLQVFEACREKFQALQDEAVNDDTAAFWAWVERAMRRAVLTGRVFGYVIILSGNVIEITLICAYDPGARAPDSFWDGMVVGIDHATLPLPLLVSHLRKVFTHGVVLNRFEISDMVLHKDFKIPYDPDEDYARRKLLSPPASQEN